MRISLVITTYRWEEALAVSLESVLRQRLLPHEIIVADDGSGPETAEVVQQFAAYCPVPVQHVWQEDEGFRLAKIRNRAIAQSAGDYLIFIDGDMILHDAFVADHRAIAEPGWFVHAKRATLKAAATRRVLAGRLEQPRWWSGLRRRRRGIRWPWLAKKKAYRKQNTRGILGCNLAFWRDDVLAVNGFNEAFEGWGREDNEFAVRMMNHGARRKTYGNIAIAFHLHHAPASRDHLKDNEQILRETIARGLNRCGNGVSQYDVREVEHTLPETLRMAEFCHINLAKGFRGGERQTELLVRGLSEAGLNQRVVARAQQPLAEHLEQLPGVETQKVRNAASALLHSSDATLVHAHEGRASHLAYGRRLLTGTPYVITRRVNRRPKTGVARRAHAGADCVVALSHAIANTLKELDDTLQIEIIPSAVSHLQSDPETVAKIREQYAGRFLIGHVGALDDRTKGQSIIIEAARSLADAYPVIHFLLIGSGRDEGMLRQHAEGLANLTFAGFVENVGDYLAAMDLFVFPSLNEGLGSALFDAMDYELPIIATRTGGIPDIIQHDDNGWLIEPGNTSALRDAITLLYADPAKRRLLAQNGKKRAGQFGVERMVRSYCRLYGRLLDADASGDN